MNMAASSRPASSPGATARKPCLAEGRHRQQGCRGLGDKEGGGVTGLKPAAIQQDDVIDFCGFLRNAQFVRLFQEIVFKQI